MAEEFKEIKLPVQLCSLAEEKLVGKRFNALEGVITFVLQELLREDAFEINEEETRIIEERLRNLGYI